MAGVNPRRTAANPKEPFVLALAAYLAVWVLLVDLGAIPFPGSLFFSSVLFFIFPAALLITFLARTLGRWLVSRGWLHKPLGAGVWRTVAMTSATLLVIVFLVEAENALRQGVLDAAEQLQKLADPDVEETRVQKLETRFVIVANRLLDDFFGGQELTEFEAGKAQTRVQEFARAVSDGTLSRLEVDLLLALYANQATNANDSPAAP